MTSDFNINEEDFELFDGTKENSKAIWKKFKTLRDELKQKLGNSVIFDNLIWKEGHQKSPKVPKYQKRGGEGMEYRKHMWVGIAHKKYEKPHRGIQLQFGLNIASKDVFCGLFIDGRADDEVLQSAKQRIETNKMGFSNFIENLDGYNVGSHGEYWSARNIEDVFDDFVSGVPNGWVAVTKEISKDEVVKPGFDTVDFVQDVFEKLMPVYSILTGEDIGVLKDFDKNKFEKEYKKYVKNPPTLNVDRFDELDNRMKVHDKVKNADYRGLKKEDIDEDLIEEVFDLFDNVASKSHQPGVLHYYGFFGSERYNKLKKNESASDSMKKEYPGDNIKENILKLRDLLHADSSTIKEAYDEYCSIPKISHNNATAYLTYRNPEKDLIVNKKTKRALDKLGIDIDLPGGNYEQYKKIRDIVRQIFEIALSIDIGNDDHFINLLDVDHFFHCFVVGELPVEETQEKLQDEIEFEASAHILAGKNIIFYGPPGTGKTRICKELVSLFCDKEHWDLVTANGEWTKYDVIGGQLLEEGEFKEGFLTKAARNGDINDPYWLIIDEINRANLDLAFGEAFTLLDVEYRKESPLTTWEEQDIHLPDNFRIVATMNSYDKAMLHKLGYAFRRRFAFVDIPSPFGSNEKKSSWSQEIEDEWISKLDQFNTEIFEKNIQPELEKWKNSLEDENKTLIESLDDFNLEECWSELFTGEWESKNPLLVFTYLAEKITKKGIVDLGYAQIVDSSKYLLSYLSLKDPLNEKDVINGVDEAIISYFLPHLEYAIPKLRQEQVEGKEELKNELKEVRKIVKDLGLKKSAVKIEKLEKEEPII